MDVAIPSDMLAAILAEAASDHEICGLLFGDEARILLAEPCANVAADPRRTFEIDPARLIAAHRAERHGGPRLIGHYHSHPSGSADPSQADGAAAVAGQLWLIVGGGKALLWRAGASGFAPERLVAE